MESSFVDEREDVQKKTFAKWINSQLVKNDKPLVQDLFEDLRDGETLLSLLEILTAQQYKRERGRMRVHHINNVNTALAVLDDNGVRLVNISSGDIVDGNHKLILGLVWSIIVHWQVQYHLRELMADLQHNNLERTLLAWCRTHTQGYSGVEVRNFTESWSDGLAFNALLHRARAEFPWEHVVALSPVARLHHAFRRAQLHHNIQPLLDPEDVNTANPDKKSILMYVMCLFQALSHAHAELSRSHADLLQHDPPSEPTTPTAAEPTQCWGGSRPASGVSLGVALGYGALLEEVLAWLLDAEERLPASQPEPAPHHSLPDLKLQFHQHEQFLLELSENQSRVGAVLEEGARLISEGGLTKEECQEIRLQMRLLNSRWESLRTLGMRRQGELHRGLMALQHQHLQAFRAWLTDTEERMSRLPRRVCTARQVQVQVQRTEELQRHLQAQQGGVESLADAVLVLEEGEGAEAGAAEFEDSLRALGERWSHTCRWTAARRDLLLNLHQRWQHLRDQASRLRAELDQHDTALKQMEANPVTNVGEVLERVKLVANIKRRLERGRSLAASLQDSAADLAREGAEGAGEEELHVDDEEEDEAGVEEQAEAEADRIEALLLILDVQAARLKELGFEVDLTECVAEETDADENRKEVEQRFGQEAGGGSRSKRRRVGGAGSSLPGWATAANLHLATCKQLLESPTDKRQEIVSILEKIETEIENHRSDFSNVEEIQQGLASESGPEEEAKQNLQSIEELKMQWEDIQRGAIHIRNTMNLLEDKENFYKNLNTFQNDLEEIHTWKNRMLKEKPSNNQLIHLRNKIRALKQLDMKLKELNAQSIVLLTKPIANNLKEDIERDFKRTNESYDELLTLLSNREAEIKSALKRKTDPDTEFKELQTKVKAYESKIIAEHAIITNKEKMEKKLEELRQLEREFVELQSTYDEVATARREQYETGSVQELNLRSSLENLLVRFSDFKNILTQKIGKLDNGVKQVVQLESERGEVSEWLDRVESFLNENDVIPIGDVTALEAKLDVSNKFDEETSTYKAKLDSIDTLSESILEDCEEGLSKSLSADRAALKARYEDVTGRGRTLNEGLRRALERTEEVFRKMSETESWISDVTEAIPREAECRIRDAAELYQVYKQFQQLRDKLHDHTMQFRNIIEQGNDILLQAGSAQPVLLARRLTQLSAAWTHATHQVYERYKVLAEAWHESGELRSWLAQEGAWLDGLQRRLLQPPAPPADAEEIHDQLYELENYVSNHSSARLSRIADVGRQLIDALIMPDWIQAEIDNVTSRWNQLQQDAAARSQVLESCARAACRSEVCVDNLTQWLQHVASLHPPLQQQQKQRLLEELEEQKSAVKEVEDQVKTYTEEGKEEAASRLGEQLELIKRKLGSVESSLSESGDTDAAAILSRLESARHTLLGVQARLQALHVTSHQPDLLRHTLRACLKFYRTLSEIKSEVETIIKTGRKMVEEKTVPDPQEFNKKIDTLKELYNKLGAQITESKTKLENALLTARELQNDLQSVSSWLDGLGDNIGKQTLELEMSRMEAVKDKLNANYVEFAKHCDAVDLQDLKDHIDDINSRWDHLKKFGFVKKETELEALQKYLSEVDQELDCVETMTTAKLNLLKNEVRSRASEVDALDNKALSKQWEKLLEKIVEASDTDHTSSAAVEYENLTDTIKRRLESPSPCASPSPSPADTLADLDRPTELKKSRIPLAVRSPVPIRKEIKEGGNRSRGNSLERGKKKAGSPMSDSVTSVMSSDSLETSARSSMPQTPETKKKNSSTFNLLKDSNLFTQISNNKIEAKPPQARPRTKPQPDPCHVVEITAHEIVKSTVSPMEPKEMYSTETVETVMELVPQTVDRVEVIYDTEGESMCGSDTEEKPHSATLGSEPTTFIVEVTKMDERMKPTLGILKRKTISFDETPKVMRISSDIPDVVPDGPWTPPPTPMEEGEECPLLFDLAVRQKEAQHKLLSDEVNEYLILDEVPKDQASLPEPSATEEVFSKDEVPAKPDGTKVESTPHYEEQISAIEPCSNKSFSPAEDNEVIYSEVEEIPQSRLSSEFEEQPLSASTPLKEDKRQLVTVVAMSPKLAAKRDANANVSVDEPPTTPSTDKPKDQSLATPVTGMKSMIPISKDRAKVEEKYQRTEDNNEPSGVEGLESGRLWRAWGRRDAEVEEFSREAEAEARRMDVLLLCAAAVTQHRDPARRLEILKNQLGSLAGSAAALISRGDSLVYQRHKDDPLLADYIQTQCQDKLRNKWAIVMSEIESHRNRAMRAEDELKELGQLVESVQRRLQQHQQQQQQPAHDDLTQLEDDVDRIQELCAELKSEHIGYCEKAAREVTTAWERLRDNSHTDRRYKPEGSLWLARTARARTSARAARRLLRVPALRGRHYAHFPMQEDALLKVKASISELQPQLEELEKEFSSVSRKCRPEQLEVLTRARDKLQADWDRLNQDYQQRYDKWCECAETWRRLYSQLEELEEWLLSAETRIQDAQQLAASQRDPIFEDIQQEMSSRSLVLQQATRETRAVVSRCSSTLARDVQLHLQLLHERWLLLRGTLAAHTDILKTEESVEQQTTAAQILSDDSSVQQQRGDAVLQQANSLLHAAPANASDETSLTVRLTLLKAREEEVSSQLKEMEVLQRSKQLHNDEQLAALHAQLQQAQSQVSAQVSLIQCKVTSLDKYSARLEAARAWLAHARACHAALHADTHGNPTAHAAQELHTSVKDKESEIGEILENYNNMERECVAAKQSVCVELKEKVSRLRDDWAALRTSLEPDRQLHLRRSSTDSDWSGRTSGRRRSSQQSPAALLAHFDTTVQQIRDWVSVELDMLRAQPVAVGDVDDIISQLDKQKGVLRELEQKKPQLDELLHTAESLKGTENRQQLHGKVTALREHWDEANARVLQRKAQLDAMLGDSQRYESRRRDADAWLARMESRLASMQPPGHTADVLEMQLREQKSFHAEVHQYKHQIELFGQLTQRLIAVYRNDDTSRIKRATEAINHRYNELNNSIVARGKALHSAVSSLQNFDRSLEKFVAWLSEAESLLEAAERDPHLLKVSPVLPLLLSIEELL